MIHSQFHSQGNTCYRVFLFCVFQIVIGIKADYAQVRLPRLISDGMVLQREQAVRIWGWGAPGEVVRVHVNGQERKGVTGPGGKWEVHLSPMHAGGPYVMRIDGSNHFVLQDILVGDVWVCSGQSNMELPMERVKEKYAQEIQQSANPMIRQFNVATRYDFVQPQDDLSSGSWQSATPEAVLNFSAAAYFFAKELYARYHVPIGLIKASVGGAPAEAWLSESALRAFPHYQAVADRFADPIYTDSIRTHEEAVSRDWYFRLRVRDSGLQQAVPWYDPGYDDSGWSGMDLPGFWADGGLGRVNGVVWFRKEVDIPPAMVGQPVRLLLGRIVDRDSVFVNGSFIGTTGYQYPPRRYTCGPGILHAGKNSIVVRVINSSGRGGFVPGKQYLLAGGGATISLEGKWKFRMGASMEPLPETTFFQYKPRGLFNGIVAAISSYTIKGVTWYQGEANTSRAQEYASLFSALIHDWRRVWGQGVFPFLFVQLANFMEKKDQPSESSWAELRDAQRSTLSVPRTGMAVAIDIGEWNDIHPLDKEDVGRRLALAARGIAYDEKGVVYSGPVYRSMEREGSGIRLHFTHTGGGLVARGDSVLRAFAIAGPDKKFVWARAVIEGRDIIVSDPGVTDPRAVRYAWADNPAGANLYNKEGLPASPFRTDENDRSPMTAEQDHRRMMEQLHIDSLRPGPSGNPGAPDAANTDETKASPYNSLPDPLILKNGRRNFPDRRGNCLAPAYRRPYHGPKLGHLPGICRPVFQMIRYRMPANLLMADLHFWPILRIKENANGKTLFNGRDHEMVWPE